jgi:hypothetical protein
MKKQRYKGESVSRSQMYIKRKTCDIRTWGKHLFLYMSSTNVDTLLCFYRFYSFEHWTMDRVQKPNNHVH